MSFSAQEVGKLREITGAGLMDCKKALVATNGDIDKAIAHLREQGIVSAAKKAGRVASEGAVCSYIHMGGKLGVLVELNCETDFVAKNAEFLELGKDIAMHIAAYSPLYVSQDEVPSKDIESEREIYKAKALAEGKPSAVAEKIVESGIKKYFSEICLLNQGFVKDTNITVQQHINNKIVTIGEKITVRRFVKFIMGEGLEKKVEANLAEEVAKLQK
ncbi:MAG: translation elongation factor Ts [Firmicutes bacterium]|nr:translation elongation factor Ts [Bacillota bacterium]MCL1953733.1 translation elongation factor Ts [Bacillota bacterium]